MENVFSGLSLLADFIFMIIIAFFLNHHHRLKVQYKTQNLFIDVKSKRMKIDCGNLTVDKIVFLCTENENEKLWKSFKSIFDVSNSNNNEEERFSLFRGWFYFDIIRVFAYQTLKNFWWVCVLIHISLISYQRVLSARR